MLKLWQLFLVTLLGTVAGFRVLELIIPPVITILVTGVNWILILVICWYAAIFLRDHLLIQGKSMNPAGKSVLITGCDSGFGYLDAVRLHQYGFIVYAGCLSVDNEGPAKLSRLKSPRMRVIPLDVTQQKSIDSVMRRLAEDRVELWALINNAGVMATSPLEWSPLDLSDFQRTIDVNLLGPVRLTRACVPLLRQTRGRLVIMTSVLSHYTNRGISGYCASKFALRGWADSVRREFDSAGWRISVTTVEPTAYRTSMGDLHTYRTLINRQWNALDERVRQEYGPGYATGLVAEFGTFLKAVRTDLSEVTDAVQDAVTERYPLKVYRPNSRVGGFLFFLIKLAPVQWLEGIHRFHGPMIRLTVWLERVLEGPTDHRP